MHHYQGSEMLIVIDYMYVHVLGVGVCVRVCLCAVCVREQAQMHLGGEVTTEQ